MPAARTAEHTRQWTPLAGAWATRHVRRACRVVGMQQEEDSSRQAPQFDMAEIESFKAFARKPNTQERVFAMIAPQIFGSEQIKKAIACLLFGGSRKVRTTATPSLAHACSQAASSRLSSVCTVEHGCCTRQIVGSAATLHA